MMTRWKQTACGILSGMLLLSGLAVPVWAEDATDPVTNEGDWVVDDITLDMQDDGTAWVTNCFQSATSVDVPAEVDGVTISGIQEGAFSQCFLLESLTLPDTITTIQDLSLIHI